MSDSGEQFSSSKMAEDAHKKAAEVQTETKSSNSSTTSSGNPGDDIILLHTKECSLCWSDFEDPIILSRCLHAFCKGCLENTLPKTSVEKIGACPVCGERFLSSDDKQRLDAARIQQLSVVCSANFLSELRRRERAASSPPACESCLENNTQTLATKICVDCKAWYCDVCAQQSHRVGSLKQHIIKEARELHAEASSCERLPLMCAVHSQFPARYWCCERTVCAECLQGPHKHHDHQLLETARKEMTSSVTCAVTEVRKKLQLHEQLRKQLINDEQQLKQAESRAMHVIDQLEQKLVLQIKQGS